MNFKFLVHIFLGLFVFSLALFTNTNAIAQIPSFVPLSGLVAWYNFNGNLIDETGGGSDGVPYGTVSYGTDRFGVANSCYQGSGASDVDIPIHNFPLGNSARSVTVFLKYNLPYAGGGRTFIGWGNNTFAGRFGLFAADTFLAMEYVNGHVKHSFTPDASWHNLTVTYPGAGGSSGIKLYIDGCLVSSNIVLPTASYSTTYGTWHGIGGHIYFLPSYNDSWTGKLDDIGVWDRELTAAEVAQIWAASPPYISGPTSLCTPGTITLTGSGPGIWSSGTPSVATVSGGIVYGVSAGTTIISYSVTTACGTITDTQMITVNTVPNAGTITGPTSVCTGASIILTNTATGGTWSSSNPVAATIGSSSGIVYGGSVGTTIISYSVSNSCGSATDTQMVTVSSPPNAGSIAGLTNICAGSAIALTNAITGGTWSSSNPAVAPVGSSGVVNGLTSGTVIISYSVTNLCGTAIDTQMITVNALPNAGTIIGLSSICIGSFISLTNTISGGTWSSSNPTIATVSGSCIITGLATGAAIISYTVTNACGTATDTLMVAVNPLPNAGDISGAGSLCIGSPTLLTNIVTGGTWSSSNATVATINSISGLVQPLAPGTVTITYTTSPNSFGCINSTLFILTVRDTLNVSAAITNIICNGDNNGSISIAVTNGSGSYGYEWSTGSTSSSVNALTSGVYTVIITDSASGCTKTQSFGLVMPAPIIIESLTQNTHCDPGNGSISVVNISGGNTPYTYLWSTGATTTNITALTAGTYTLSVTDSNLCIKHFSIVVGEDSCDDIVIHDVITPNGDGKNDVWVIEWISKYPNNVVKVFDKWGDEIFSANNYKNDWSGDGKSSAIPDGTYFYLIKLNAQNPPRGKDHYTGSLLIKR